MERCSQCGRPLETESPLVCQLIECPNEIVVKFRAAWARYMNDFLLAALQRKFDHPVSH